MKKKYNFMDLIDKEAEDEYYKIKEELDRKYNAKNYPPSQRNMSIEQIKKMLKKAEEDKAKRAKGGIAGVL
jgi:FtsZ-interacting cell division protein YlmF